LASAEDGPGGGTFGSQRVYVTLVLADTSAWARRALPQVARLLARTIEADRMAITLPVTLELLRSARNQRELREDARLYDALVQLEVTPEVGDRAREVQATLSATGHHRGPSLTDLLAAAAAELGGAVLLHADRHFDLIARVTGQPLWRLRT
jgi:predicted nucleic acid-binding protein